MAADEGANLDGAASSTLESLPGPKDEVWQNSPLGSSDDWPPALRAFAAFVSTLPHPAAIYWGSELVLIHNEAWKDVADGAAKQGAPQRERLAEEALSLIRTAMLGRSRNTEFAESFLRTEPKDGASYSAVVSPLMNKDQRSDGAVVQLMRTSRAPAEQKNEQGGVLDWAQSFIRGGKDTGNGAQNPFDSLPLDENPFFQRFASMLPTGLAILNHKAEAVFVNEQFFELTSAVEGDFKAWPQSIHDDDYDRVMDAYQNAFKHPGESLRVDFRTAGKGNNWRLLMLSPLGNSKMRDESIEKYGGFICAVIDISINKAQEEDQRRAATEATERKEQQERFIDMISHEIRNPLSAILHCAEEILELVEEGKDSGTKMTQLSTASVTESAETIKLCVAHQKNIVDDILSFSKLDASMLSLCPKSVQPKRQLGDTLKMFQPEIKKQHMTLSYDMDHSYNDFNVDWVKADFVRISQILVNLITNAIKFTVRKEGEKKITVMLGASMERPTSYPPNVVFFDNEDLGYRMDGTNSSEWGNGEAFYLMIAVKDSGIGISKKNQVKLFQRFRQATPKTEESYGGSGLGLLISRKLCQLHGGEIGVSSIEGEGSTFGFFLKVRRLETGGEAPPQKDRIDEKTLQKDVQQVADKNAPIESVDDSDKREDLSDPKVADLKEAGPGATGDGRRQNTAEIASHVKLPAGDEYGTSARPSLGKHTSSGAKSRPNLAKKTSSGRQIPSTLEKMQRETDRSREDARLKNGPVDGIPAGVQAHILLVEDNMINQRILKRKLEAKKFTVTTANNGREAVDSVQDAGPSGHDTQGQEPFDVILMDQEMPVLDGNQASKEIRALEHDGKVPRIPILGVTANVRDEQKAHMRDAGMDDVISKPYSIEDLIIKIMELKEKGKGS